MDQSIIYLSLTILGLCFGSFAGASVWRLRARQLKLDKADGNHVSRSEYKKLEKLTKVTLSSDRSVCLNCSYNLRWYDLIPLFSWISLGGKCRKCRKPIGYFEPLMELGVAGYFVLSYYFWSTPLTDTLQFTRFILWLIASVPLAISFAYDAKWSLLDEGLNYLLVVIGLITSALLTVGSPDKISTFLSIVGSVLILGGLYYLLYKISGGRLVGNGDPALALGLSLMLADWQLAFLALFAANLIGCIVVIPGLLSGKLKRNSQVPFGPFLILGFIVAGLFGHSIISTVFSNLT